MSDCHKTRELYSLVLEQEASRLDQRYFDSHLSACAECRRDWLDFKSSQSLLAALPRPVVPVAVEPAWWQAWVPRFGLAAAAAALVAMVTLPRTPVSNDVAALPAPGSTAQVQPVVDRLEDRFPDLPAEVLRSLDEESYVLDRMTVRPSVSGGSRVVAPVDYESGGTVYVTF